MKILSRPNGNAEEYGKWSVNPYLGCTNGCLYCYLKQGVWAHALGGDKPHLKKGLVSEEHAYHVAMAEILGHRDEIIKDGGLFMSFVTDPLCKDCRKLFLGIARSAASRNIPVIILSKSTGMDIRFWGYHLLVSFAHWYLEKNGEKIKVSFGTTLTGYDELEPFAPRNHERILQMRTYHEDGFSVWASIEPVIDFESSFDMTRQALDAGCEHFKIGLMTKNTKVCRNGFEIGGHKFKAYDVIDCMHFIEDVMRLTEGKATVYWKQSVRDLLETIYTSAAVDELLNFPHSVGKDWSMFNDITKED